MVNEPKMDRLPGDPVPEDKKETGDLSNPTKVKRRETLDKLEARQADNDVLFILSSIEGRRFYWRLMKKCGIFMTSFTGNNTTFFNEGQRNVGLQLLNDLNRIAPKAYFMMIEEAKLEEAKKA